MIADELMKRYPNVAGAQRGYDCLQNGLHNVALATHANLYAGAMLVNTRRGYQTYLVDKTTAYCEGWTWLTDYYPELDLDQIAALGGVDVTAELVSQALQIKPDGFNFRSVLAFLNPYIGDIRDLLIASYLSGD